MEETIETPNGGHYAQCGTMVATTESNNFIHVRKCDGCGEMHIHSTVFTDIILLVFTALTAEAGFSAEVTAPADATALMANIYPALGPIMGVLAMIVGALCLYRLDDGVVINPGDQR